jgi:hypothetical protein
MPILPFPEWKPDLSDYGGGTTATILNVLPQVDGYGPFPDFTVFTSALPATCRGAFYARKTDGSVAFFAGTSTKLYLLDNTDFSWDDVSLGSGTYSALSSTDQWRFAQFNNFVFATQANAVVQVFDLTSSTNFANLAGSPPQARYISIVGRFVVLSGLLSNPYRVHWSGLNATTTWTSGVNQSDFQDLADGGIVRGVAGGEFGIIVQDAAVRRMTYAPGSPVIFQIDRIAEDKGSQAPYSIISAGDRRFFLSQQGFQMLSASGFVPIGREKVDRFFFRDWDSAALHVMTGAADPGSSRVFWSYKSVAGTTGQFDKLLCYDYALDRFSLIQHSGVYLMSLARTGLTLENLDAISGSIDALPFSLDDVSTASAPILAAFDTGSQAALASGSPLEAILTSGEQGGPTQRIFVRGFTPITDAPTAFGAVSGRENMKAAATFNAEQEMNAQGFVPARKSTRHARGRLRIPAGTAWTFASGVEPDVMTEGSR